MKIKNVDYLKQDFERIYNSKEIEWDQFKDKTVLITGATGLIGSLLCKYFIYTNEHKNLNVRILALARNNQKAEMLYSEFINSEFLKFIISDITEPVCIIEDIDYIFHCASITTSKIMISLPVETLITSIDGTKNLLELAREKQVKAFIYVSSMEVYGSFENLNHDVTEQDIGYIDPLAVRSNYPESKRLCENMCVAYYKEYGVHTRLARLAQTFGAGILPGENRVFAQFARGVMKGEDIVLHTRGLSEGNYCYTADAIKGLLVLALNGVDGEAYNVSNPDTHTTIADMAKMVAQEFGGGNSKVVFDIPRENIYGYATETKMRLSSEKLQDLGWKPEVGLKEMYDRMIEYMKKHAI